MELFPGLGVVDELRGVANEVHGVMSPGVDEGVLLKAPRAQVKVSGLRAGQTASYVPANTPVNITLYGLLQSVLSWLSG